MQKKIEPRIIVDGYETLLGYVSIEDGKLVSYTIEIPPDRNYGRDIIRAHFKPKLKGGRFFPRRINGPQ